MDSRTVVEIEHLKKSYGDVRAVDDLSFEVRRGEIFGFVGPNGAGKTTTIECAEGLRRPDSGRVRMLGLDPLTDGYELKERLGIQLQQTALPARMKVQEAVELFAAFYPKSVDSHRLLDQLGLGDKTNAYFDKLSGGQKQRLFIALALVNDPELIVLDELTTGLDPQARRAMWDLVREVRSRGRTVILTTHFMEEAERLCDRVAIIDHGRLVALDTPERLIRSLSSDNRVVFTITEGLDVEGLRSLPGITRLEKTGGRVIVHGPSPKLVVDVVNYLSSRDVPIRDLRTEQASLEDVFLALTGREMRD
jgi:ABC-2 type transport system ATP-binding protein